MKLSIVEIDLRLRESCRENCINWRGAALRSGDNVHYKEQHHKVLVGQIIDIRDYDKIMDSEQSLITKRGKHVMTRMVLIRRRSRIEGQSIRKPDPAEYCHVPDCLKEIMDTTEVEWIPASCIVGPCFIFHIDHIQKGIVGCKGMDKVYFVRFRKSQNGKLLPISSKDWNSFYRDQRYPYVESYPE
jgi:hypothetical protein